MKKVLLSSIAMAMFFAGSLGLFILVACSEPKPMNEDEAKEEQKASVVSVELEPEFDPLELVIVEEPEVVSSFERNEPIRKEQAARSYSSISSPYGHDPSLAEAASPVSSGDCSGEEKRKHSPNDNYLLGFDEDVDDVHDMEIYMEDY